MQSKKYRYFDIGIDTFTLRILKIFKCKKKLKQILKELIKSIQQTF